MSSLVKAAAAAAIAGPDGEKVSTLILGMGPCGLGAAWRLDELSRLGIKHADSWMCVDQATTSGGLAKSMVDDKGFTWDLGGHVIFSHYSYFSRLLDALIPASGWACKVREAWVWMRGTFIPYPLQQNLHRLPKPEIEAAIQGLVQAERIRNTGAKPKNFGEWLQQSFGQGLCDSFMVPYNKKVWAYAPELMNVEWMGDRVATVDLTRVLHNVLNQKDELGWGPNNTFRFPLHGGTGSIWTALTKALPASRMRLGKKLVDLDALQRLARFEDGSTVSFENLVSTMPLDQLIRITRNLPGYTRESLDKLAAQFRYSSTHIIGFGLAGSNPPPHLATKCWLYFPQDDSPFYRATILSNYSPNVVARPGEQWSIMTEVSESRDNPVDSATIVAQAERGLINSKLITPEDKILSRFHIRLEYGYPTPFVGRDALLNPLHAALESCGILSRGRFGSWKYEVSNQDHALMLGVEAVDRIVLQGEEPTHKYPQLVNANRDTAGRQPFLKGSPLEKQRQ